MLLAALKSLLFSTLVQATKRNLDAVARRGEPRLVDSPEKEWFAHENRLLSQKGACWCQLAQGQTLMLTPPGFHQNTTSDTL